MVAKIIKNKFLRMTFKIWYFMELNSCFNLSFGKLVVSPMYYLVQTMIIHTHRDVILSFMTTQFKAQ